MSYCTQQDLIDRFSEAELIQLTDRAGAADAIDATVIAKAIAGATGKIDSRIAKAYTLPLSSVPDVLTDCACDMARYLLYKDDAPEIVKDRYKEALKWLDAVANGSVTLGLDQTGAEPENTGSEPIFLADDDERFSAGAVW